MTVTAPPPSPGPFGRRLAAQLLAPEHRPSRPGWVVHAVVSVLAVLGAFTLWNDLAPTWRIVALAGVAAIVVFRLLPLGRWLGTPGTVLEYIGAALGVVVIPLFSLLGVDAALAHLGVGRVPPVLGVLIGGLLFCAFARASLEPVWTAHRFPMPWVWAGAVAALFAIVLPVVVFAAVKVMSDGARVTQQATVSQLDVIVLRTDAPPPRAPTARPGDWVVRTWTGIVHGDRIAWTGGRRPRLDGQADADRVLILLPPRADNGVPARWLALADRVEPRATPTYALLDRPTGKQVGLWQAPLSGPTGRAGAAMALSALPASAATPEPTLGLLAATESPTAAADLALAIAHRPILLFDSREPVPHPLDVDRLFTLHLFSGCRPGQNAAQLCKRLGRADELRSGYDHLAFDTRAVADARVPNKIYVHVTHVASDGEHGAGRIYLDYWWYLADNPANSGDGAFCGPGFTLGDITCFDHQSDWEGVTVILDARRPAAAPVAVNYAQHDGTVRYSWSVLKSIWGETQQTAPPAATLFAAGGDPGIRPLVYSARGTHASYPISCDRSSCPRTALEQFAGKDILRDNEHDGAKPWSGITDAGCAGQCVALLPTRLNGARPEGWNGWGGRWGTAGCVIGVFCAAAPPPQSPGRQPRYENPSCTDTAYAMGSSGPVARPVPRCTPPVPIGAGRHNALLALGDSYSSGEGAGSDASSGSCHRSANAWPTLLAQRRHLDVLPSVACSGATLSDLLEGRPDGEPERRQSQIAGIARNPSVITVTIGGNDLGFRRILETCIVRDCVAAFHRPSGDVLDARIDTLARALPAAYRRIQAAAPAARVVVVDYPQLFADGVPNCAALNTITATEGAYLNAEVQRADVAILDAARQGGVTGVDVSTALAGGELSCSGTQYINHVGPRLDVLSSSFHPNAAGQERIADAVAAALAKLDK